MKTKLQEKANRKKIAGFATLAVAAALIIGNGALTLKVFASNEVPEIQTDQTYQQPNSASSSQNKSITTATGSQIELSSLEDSKDMAAKRTIEDMSKEQAVEIAAKAVEDQLGISLNNAYATPILCTLEDKSGNYYFVSFVDKQSLNVEDHKQARMDKSAVKSTSDVYITFLDAKTGEIISVEKNPTAPHG